MNPIQLPNGWTLVPPTTTSSPPPLLPFPSGDPLAQLLPLLLGGGAGNPQSLISLVVPLIGVVLQVAHALKTQMQGTSPGTNAPLEQFDQAFWQHVLSVFAPKPSAPPAG